MQSTFSLSRRVDASEAQETDVLVVGGGVIGVAVAYYLALRGIRVTVVESGDVGKACSWGNSGLVAVSQCMPMPSMRALWEGLRSMFDASGQIRLKPQRRAGFWGWTGRFLTECPRNHTDDARYLHDFARFSADLHRDLAGRLEDTYGYCEPGWLHVFRSERALRRAAVAANRLRHRGVDAVILDAGDVKGIEPALRDGVVGGVLYRENAHLQPSEFVHALARGATSLGVRMVTGSRVTRFRTGSRRALSAVTSTGDMRFDTVVLAAGAWTGDLAQRLGIHLPIEPARGHSVTFDANVKWALPILLAEPHIMLTSHGGEMRVTSGLELIGFDERVSRRRLERMLTTPAQYVEGFSAKRGSEWIGFRPLTPDDLPIIGPVHEYANVYIASGHGTLGVTLAPGTGAVIADVVSGATPSAEYSRFLPQRFRGR